MTTAPLEIIDNNGTIQPPERKLWMARRQALITELGAIEDYLGMERSIVPRHKRGQADYLTRQDADGERVAQPS